MARTPLAPVSKETRLREAVRLAEAGQIDLARTAFEEAIAVDRRNPDLLYNLARLEEVAGNVDRAAQLYSRVLADRASPLAARAFNRIATRFVLTDLASLSPAGIKAVLQAEGLARQPVIDVALRMIVATEKTLAEAIGGLTADAASERAVGQGLVRPRLAGALISDMLMTCLRMGIVRYPELERVLSGVRASLLLDSGGDCFEDRQTTDLALALMVQGWNNDHAWAETASETAALDRLAVDRAGLLAGDRAQVRALVLKALYRPLDSLIAPQLAPDEAKRLKPRAVREVVEAQVIARRRQRDLGARVPSLSPVVDETSQRVAEQYEKAPYPRWTSLQVSQPGALKQSLAGYVGADRVAFMDAAFDILVAGCGTGQQVLQSATAYGPQARITALDLSRASLGYAADMADRHKIANVSFLQGDILGIEALAASFDIIECVGVLHHMADWRAGWRALLGRLKPRGLMYVGLYSATSRKNLRALRSDQAYPGPGCTDEAARKFRRDLMLRPEAKPGGELKISRDFHNLNAFRDLVLHESEAHVSIAEIDGFLKENDLVFRGFTVDPQVQASFLAANPRSKPPGTLNQWTAFEMKHPRTFDGMYRFWVERSR